MAKYYELQNIIIYNEKGEKNKIYAHSDILFNTTNILGNEYLSSSKFDFKIKRASGCDILSRKNKENFTCNENYYLKTPSEYYEKDTYKYNVYINSKDIKVERIEDYIEEFEKGEEKRISKQFKCKVINNDFEFVVHKSKIHFLTKEEFEKKWTYKLNERFTKLENIIKRCKENSRFEQTKETCNFYQDKINNGFYCIYREYYYEKVEEFIYREYYKTVKSDLLIKQEKINKIISSALEVSYIHKPSLLKVLNALNVDINELDIEELERKLKN